jgi:hypothetical protein
LRPCFAFSVCFLCRAKVSRPFPFGRQIQNASRGGASLFNYLKSGGKIRGRVIVGFVVVDKQLVLFAFNVHFVFYFVDFAVRKVWRLDIRVVCHVSCFHFAIHPLNLNSTHPMDGSRQQCISAF